MSKEEVSIWNLKKVIKARYSCKKYGDRKVAPEKIQAILEAGRLAPTAANLQEQHVYVIQSACPFQNR